MKKCKLCLRLFGPRSDGESVCGACRTKGRKADETIARQYNPAATARLPFKAKAASRRHQNR